MTEAFHQKIDVFICLLKVEGDYFCFGFFVVVAADGVGFDNPLCKCYEDYVAFFCIVCSGFSASGFSSLNSPSIEVILFSIDFRRLSRWVNINPKELKKF